MLGQRVLTAIVLLALLLPALFAPVAWPFALLTLVFIGAAGWEWARLNGGARAGALTLGVAVGLVCGASVVAGWHQGAPSVSWWVATGAWVLGGAAALRAGPQTWLHWPVALRWVLGALALWLAWLGLANARAIGVNFILSVFCLVWVADIAAYFGGRALGRRKLAPAISPGKTWEGVGCGIAATLALALGWTAFVDASPSIDSLSVYGRISDRLGSVGLALVVIFLAAMSVVGDLFESLVKRAAGVKDSSALLPGHGGVLDRIDALLPVFPIAMAFATL